MNQEIERKIIVILKILNKNPKSPLGSRSISRELEDYGISLTERAIRYHLKIMDEKGLTQNWGKEGRTITKKGQEELKNALVSDKVGLIISKIDTLSYRTTFDMERKSGKIILNVSFITSSKFNRALKIMQPIFKAQLGMSNLVAVAQEGEKLGDVYIPKNFTGFGTVCSVTINGILLKQGIPVEARFGGILQIEKGEPLRFTELISYSGSSLDPLEIFIKSKMTDVLGAARKGEGKILASFREIPAECIEEAEKILEELHKIGLRGTIVLGKPSQPLLEIPVTIGRTGMVVIGGLNPLASLEETGIETENRAMSTMIEFEKLVKFEEII